MRNRRPGAAAGLLCGLALIPSARAQGPVGRSFTYQGTLVVSGAPADGAYDFEFALYDAPMGGAPVGPTLADVVARLRPIQFTWKASGRRDVGLAAEEVAAVDPLLAFRNAEGAVEGVNHAQITAVLVRALQQQQAQIHALKALVCGTQPEAAACLEPADRP
jgi:hypothetical protein